MKKSLLTWGLLLVAAGCSPPGPHALLGQNAPRATLTDLQGNATELVPNDATVMILDFWASWCGPCLAAMPVVADVAESYIDNGVRLVAVNVGEDAATVRDFTSGKAMVSHVVLDRDGGVSELYKVDGLPTIMLIDGEGVIQAVYEGYSRDLRDEMHRDIETLLNGTSLVNAAVAP